MSEKRAKELRAKLKKGGNGDGGSPKGVKFPPKPQMIVQIHVFKNGTVDVLGFPLSFGQAISIMGAGIARVSGYFIEMARQGKVDAKGNLLPEPESNILKPGDPGYNVPPGV